MHNLTTPQVDHSASIYIVPTFFGSRQRGLSLERCVVYGTSVQCLAHGRAEGGKKQKGKVG